MKSSYLGSKSIHCLKHVIVARIYFSSNKVMGGHALLLLFFVGRSTIIH